MYHVGSSEYLDIVISTAVDPEVVIEVKIRNVVDVIVIVETVDVVVSVFADSVDEVVVSFV